MIQNTSQSVAVGMVVEAVANQKFVDGAAGVDSARGTALADTPNDQYEQKRRSHRVCITGHRPQKLSRPEDDIKVDLENTILELINDGYTTFIIGMCYGVDIWAGEIIVRLRNEQKRYGQYTLTQVVQKRRPEGEARKPATTNPCHLNTTADTSTSTDAAAPCPAKAASEKKPIKLIAAVPFEGFNEKWIIDCHNWKSRYDKLLGDADLVKYISPEYTSDAYKIRNEWMVNHSGLVLGVCNGRSYKPSGTANTIGYAKKQKVQTKIIRG